jgi:hypothetical protein
VATQGIVNIVGTGQITESSDTIILNNVATGYGQQKEGPGTYYRKARTGKGFRNKPHEIYHK